MNRDLISPPTPSPERELAVVRAVALGRQERAEARQRLAAPAGEGCCGLTFTSHAKRIICPLCGKPARAN